jgi:hypothetical protein
MPPSSWLLFLVLGMAVGLRAWRPRADLSLRWAVPIGVLVTLIGLILAVTPSTRILLKVEQLGITIPIAPGHMSPLTAVLFVGGGSSFLASLRWPVARRRLGQTSWWLACLLMAVGLFLILAYLIGAEQLHGIPDFPPAALTSASFLLLGIALLCLTDLRPPETREALTYPLQQVANLGGDGNETLHAQKDGTPSSVEVSARIIAVEGQRS